MNTDYDFPFTYDDDDDHLLFSHTHHVTQPFDFLDSDTDGDNGVHSVLISEAHSFLNTPLSVYDHFLPQNHSNSNVNMFKDPSLGSAVVGSSQLTEDDLFSSDDSDFDGIDSPHELPESSDIELDLGVDTSIFLDFPYDHCNWSLELGQESSGDGASNDDMFASLALSYSNQTGRLTAPPSSSLQMVPQSSILKDMLGYISDFHSISHKVSPMKWEECVFSGNQLPLTRTRQWITDTFTTVLCYIHSSLQSRSKCSFILRSKRKGGSHLRHGVQLGIRSSSHSLTFNCDHPGPQDAKFVQLALVISHSLDALLKDKVVSKRDIFYRHPIIFKTQSVVNHITDKLAFLMGISRQMLNITAAAKGLAVGACVLERPGGRIAFTHTEGTLIHRSETNEVFKIQSVSWILVVEKEACYRTLAGSPLGKQALSDGLIVTGKGYPDLSTRAFLHTATTASPDLEILSYALVDLDPDGLLIYLTYKYGSRALSHENLTLVCPSLQWLGPRHEDIFHWSYLKLLPSSALMPLSFRDRKKAIDVLKMPACEENGPETDIRDALQLILMFNTKVEIQSLETKSQSLHDWVQTAMLK